LLQLLKSKKKKDSFTLIVFAKGNLRMNIYSINYVRQFEGEDGPSIIEDDFEVGSENIAGAYIIGDEFLKIMYKDDESVCEIISVNLLPVNIINWPGDGEPCDCPYCRTERAAPEDIIEFDCSCGKKHKFIDDFGMIKCDCGKFIRREDLVGNNGNFTLIDI
jgi:hypothetical protein